MTKFSTPKITEFMNDIQAGSTEWYVMAIKIRELHLQCDPSLTEEIKYGGLVFLQEKELMSGIFIRNEHISIEFGQGSSLSDPNGVLEGKGKLRRHIKVRSLDDIATKNVIHYVQENLVD